MHWVDPDSLPETRGKVILFLLNPLGDVDGFVLKHADGTHQQVHFPPHLDKLVTRKVRVGDSMRVRGGKPRGANMIAAISLTTKQDVETIEEGPHHHEHSQKHGDGHGQGGAPMDVQRVSRSSRCSGIARQFVMGR